MSQYLGVTFTPVIPTEDPQLHSASYPFCFGHPDCPCHQDVDAVNKVNEYYHAGLMTAEEATNFVKGDLSNVVQ